MGGCRCGTGGGPIKTHRLDVSFTHTTGSTVTITDPVLTINGIGVTGLALQASPAQSNDIPPGTKVLHYTFQRGSNPGGAAVGFSYTVTDVADESTDESITLTVDFYTCSDTCRG